MSQKNVEILIRAGEVFAAGDLDRWIAELIDPEPVWQTAEQDPDAAIHRGPTAVRRYVDQWSDSFDGLSADVEEIIDVDDDRVFTWVHWAGRGRTSGAHADWYLAIIYTMRDGRVVRAEEYFDRAEALEAAGQSE